MYKILSRILCIVTPTHLNDNYERVQLHYSQTMISTLRYFIFSQYYIHQFL